MMSAWRDPSAMQNNNNSVKTDSGMQHHRITAVTENGGSNGGAVHTPAPSSSPSDSDPDKSNAANMECVVCGDKSSGKHYGQYTCEGCKSFFKRSVRRNLSYQCRGTKNCPIDQHHRNQCQYCRMKKCLKSGMRREAVQRGRIQTQPLLPGQYPFINGDFMGNPSFVGGYISALMRAEAYTNSYRHCFPPNYIGGDVQEIATRLLYSSVGCCREFPYFRDLNANDQWCLVKNSWTDLFIISTAQASPQLLAQQIQVFAAANLQSSQYNGIYQSCALFQERVDRIKQLHMDTAEFSCLKAIVLYCSDAQGLQDAGFVDNMQEKSQMALEEYARTQFPNQASRTGRILLRLPGLKSVSAAIIESLFFSRLPHSKTGNFDTLLREMLLGGTGNVNSFNGWPYAQPALPSC